MSFYVAPHLRGLGPMPHRPCLALVVGAPEVREYCFRFVDEDVPSGTYSDVVKTTTVP